MGITKRVQIAAGHRNLNLKITFASWHTMCHPYTNRILIILGLQSPYRALERAPSIRLHAARFAFLSFAHSMGAQTFRPSAVLSFCPCLLMVSSADCALPSGNADLIRPSADVVCHWSERIFDPRCPVLFLRFVDVAAYRAQRLIGILTLGSLQSPRADLDRAFSATCPTHFLVARPCDISSPRENRGEGQTDGVKRSLGGKGFGDSTNDAWFGPFLAPIRVRSNIPPFCPFPPCNLMVSSADGALPSVDSSPNTISLDLSLGQYSHTLEHSVASGQTGQSSIPDSGQQKAMGFN